jgi:hypothetical protein
MSDDTTTKVPAKTRTAHNCGCLTGTGQTCTATTQRAFAQGHDARMAGRVAQMIADGKLTADEGEKLVREAGGGDLLVSKTRHSAKLRAERAAGPKTPKKAKATKEQAAAIAKVPSVVGQAVEVFHGKRKFHAVVVRNAAEELVARHRLNSKNCDHQVSVEDGEVFAGEVL